MRTTTRFHSKSPVSPFFFQAEDGIRDLYVTGVQTCALPIWPRSPCGRRRCPDAAPAAGAGSRRRSEERRVGKSVDLGGRRIIKKKKSGNVLGLEREGNLPDLIQERD